MPRHVALLRAVNVGGPSRRLAMVDLRRIVADLGHAHVATYIQTGNVVLTCDEPDAAVVGAGIEKALLDELGLVSQVIAFDRDSYAAAVDANPYPDEAAADPKKVHATFRSAPPGPDELDRLAGAVERAQAKGSRDTLTVVDRVVYLHLPDGMGRSLLAEQLMKLPTKTLADGGGTARNWATVRTLREMLDI